jgi:hypothetical protein
MLDMPGWSATRIIRYGLCSFHSSSQRVLPQRVSRRASGGYCGTGTVPHRGTRGRLLLLRRGCTVLWPGHGRVCGYLGGSADARPLRSLHTQHRAPSMVSPPWGDKQGRGAQLFIRLCRYSPPESYIPSLDFFFELRNVAIHRDGRCDERLARAAELAGHTIHVGTRVSWTFSLVMQLHHLLTDYLTDVDRGAVRVLGLETRCGRPYWFIDEALSEEEKGIGR